MWACTIRLPKHALQDLISNRAQSQVSSAPPPPKLLKKRVGPWAWWDALVKRGSHNRSVAEAAPVNHVDYYDIIAGNVLRFLAIRSLVNFGATGKSHRVAMMVGWESSAGRSTLPIRKSWSDD